MYLFGNKLHRLSSETGYLPNLKRYFTF